MREILLMNESLIVRIEEILKFYANKNNYPNIINNDNGFFADSILNDIEKMKDEMNLNENYVGEEMEIENVDSEFLERLKEILKIK